MLEIEIDKDLVSMTAVKVVSVSVKLDYTPTIENLQWSFGGKPFSDWKKWNSDEKKYSGEPFITFAEQPIINNGKLSAKIKFDIVYGTNDLKSSGLRSRYLDLIGLYDLAISDKSTRYLASVKIKLNVYDSYHSYDEIKPAIDEIFNTAKGNRYLDYQVIGKSVEGRDMHFVVMAKDKQSVTQYLNFTIPKMLNNPGELQKIIKTEGAYNHKVAVFFNNIHANETPTVDSILTLLKLLATNDSITYKPAVNQNNVVINIDEVLNKVIFLFNFTVNPDGRHDQTRSNANGFDLNRDMAYQTQPESIAAAQQIVKWNPLILLDLHGFQQEFLFEPCTPPHDPNFEYDLLMEGMIPQAELMGKALIANTKYKSYRIPQFRSSYGWDDVSPRDVTSFAMSQGAIGQTIEIAELNQDSHDALIYAIYAVIKYTIDESYRLFYNHLEYYRRGVEGIDSRTVDKYLVNAKKEVIGRPRGAYENFFPDYYVISIDSNLQKNILVAYTAVQYLIRNGVKVYKTTKEVKLNNRNYPVGTYVIPLRQAKRGFANSVLFNGIDVSDFEGIYTIMVMNFPALRGFDITVVRKQGVFEGSLESVSNVVIPTTELVSGSTEVVIKNSNNDAIKAVNRLLAHNKPVKLLLQNGIGYKMGDYLVNTEDLNSIKDLYLLDVLPYNGRCLTLDITEPKVACKEDTQTMFVLKELGFNIVKDKKDCNVIIDNYGQLARKADIENGKNYIGISQYSLKFIKNTNLLPGFDYGQTNLYHEGLIRAEITQDSLLTAGYNQHELLYIATGSWIEKVPIDAKILARVSAKEDFYVCGWWPGHEAAYGKILAIGGKIKNSNITLFATDITNKAHPQNSYRLLANAIYSSMLDEIIIPQKSTWKYLDDGSDQGTAWREIPFTDLSWASGKAQLGYGDGDEKTVVSYGDNPRKKYITTYFRKSFYIPDASVYKSLMLKLLKDDGAVVYLNGVEVARKDMPSGDINYKTKALTSVSGVEEETYYESNIEPTLLLNGNNLLAVEIHQKSSLNLDISFDLLLVGSKRV